MPRRTRAKPRVTNTQRAVPAVPMEAPNEIVAPAEAPARATAARPAAQPRAVRVAYGGVRESAVGTDYSYVMKDVVRIAVLGFVLIGAMVAVAVLMPQ